MHHLRAFNFFYALKSNTIDIAKTSYYELFGHIQAILPHCDPLGLCRY